MTTECPRPEKIPYKTEAEALRRRNSLRHRGGSSDLAVYRCVCKSWHVGHSRERLNKRIATALPHRRRLPGAKRKAC